MAGANAAQTAAAPPNQNELDRRARVSKAFLDKDENKTTSGPQRDDTALLKTLKEGTATGDVHRQTGVDQTKVKLSSAKRNSGPSPLALNGASYNALMTLQAISDLDSTPFAGASSLQDRLSRASVGTSAYAKLLAAAKTVQKLGSAGTGDLVALGSAVPHDHIDVLRQVNSESKGQSLARLMGDWKDEVDLKTSLKASYTKKELQDMAKFFENRPHQDRIAFAKLVAESFDSKEKAKEILEGHTLWNDGNKFFVSLRNRVNYL